MRVLHVENDVASATAVRAMLLGVVDECAWTELGEVALEMAQDGKYDLILLDLMLPDIDGYEVANRLHSADVDTPCLILSGLVDRDSEFSTMAFGGSDYLLKPFSRTELIQRVQTAVSRAPVFRSQHAHKLPVYIDENRADGSESRRVRRFTTFKSAKIDYGHGARCRIVNISEFGAGILLLDESEKLPPSFMLEFDAGETKFCRLCWRDGDRMGVKFMEQ